VSNDTTNHAVWNSAAPAANSSSSTAKVMRSNTLLMRPNTSMKRRTSAMCQRCGLCRCSASTASVLIAIAGTWCGMRVRGSSRELGRLTTLAVVQAIFFVILADALFAVLFMELDI